MKDESAAGVVVPEVAQPHPLVRVLNRGGRVIARTGYPLVRLDEPILLDEARRRTGLEDFGGDAFREPLGRLLLSFENEAGLTLLGRIAARQDLLRLLSNRLRMQEDRRRHPQIAGEQVRRPIFVTGLPRTGTTLLHGLLAQDPAHRAPLNWETMFPSPPPERSRYLSDQRIELAARQLRWFYRLNPEFRRIHPIGARLPEECLIITSHSFRSFQFETSHRVPSYQAWLEESDLRLSYADHRRFLQHLQWRCPAERWVVKAPAHLYGFEAIFAVYPDAHVVLTHRDPLEVVPSMASLHSVLRSTFSDTVDPKEVGLEVTRRWAEGIRRALAHRDSGRVAASRFCDVQYADLMRDPIGAVKQIYALFDLEFTPVAEQRMRRFLAENPKDKHGRHRYSLEQFGLSAEQERARYRTYSERFGF